MGVVYLAFDPLLKRPLAIKAVREFSSDGAATLIRFQREAEISAQLNHPNIVTVHDVGQDPYVGPFMAMEFIDGLPLADLILQGIPTETTVHLLLQGMSALQAAERAGITHRDIKPANILVSHDGRLKLMDFGIARGEDSRLTQTGQIFGTPSYTAPEALGGAEPSSASDRYAFAVTAFQMLTCQLPFECATIAATLFRIAHEPPQYPDTMGAEVRAVFERALAKHPEDRYPDLDSFVRELIAAVDLPAGTRAKFLDRMTGAGGGAVAHLIEAHAQATASFAREWPTQATPARAFQTGTNELATEAFRSSKPDPTGIAGGDRAGSASATTEFLVSEAPPPPPARRRGWPILAAAGLLVAGILGGGAAWLARTRRPRLQSSASPAGATINLGGKEHGQPDPARPAYLVQVVTRPPGAEAFLNGVAQGTTPIGRLQVPGSGRQELVLRLRDRQDWSQVLAPDRPLPSVITLQPRPARAALRTGAPAPPAAAALPEGGPAAPPTPAPRVELPAATKGETPPEPKVEAGTRAGQQNALPEPSRQERRH
jgi:serine/threonine-protein kinase